MLAGTELVQTAIVAELYGKFSQLPGLQKHFALKVAGMIPGSFPACGSIQRKDQPGVTRGRCSELLCLFQEFFDLLITGYRTDGVFISHIVSDLMFFCSNRGGFFSKSGRKKGALQPLVVSKTKLLSSIAQYSGPVFSLSGSSYPPEPVHQHRS